MFSCQEYNPDVFIDRPAAIQKLRGWADAVEVEKRVLSIIAPPGGGKTWVLKNLRATLEKTKRHFVIEINVPDLVNDREEQDPNKTINSGAFEAWFEGVQENARKYCSNIQPISHVPDRSARIREFVRRLCECKLNKAPLVLVDGYDEITESQAGIVSLRILEPLLEKPCMRMLIAHRPERAIKGDVLRRNSDRVPLLLHLLDPLSPGFAIRQFEALFRKEYPNMPVPDPSVWMEKLQHYKWNHPLANCFLFNRGMEPVPGQWRPLTYQDYYDCCRAIIERPNGLGVPRYPALLPAEFKALHSIATELGNGWSQSQAETLLGLNNFYLSDITKKLFNLGLILSVSESPPFYKISDGLCDLLREIDGARL